MTRMGFIAAGLLLATTSVALADSINDRQAAQARKIEQGRKTGSITWTEGLKLRAEQRRISRTEAQFRADGYLDRSERRTLRDMQDTAAEHIVDEKSDRLRRATWMPRFGL